MNETLVSYEGVKRLRFHYDPNEWLHFNFKLLSSNKETNKFLIRLILKLFV